MVSFLRESSGGQAQPEREERPGEYLLKQVRDEALVISRTGGGALPEQA